MQVHVSFGNMAFGTIDVLLDENDEYQSVGGTVLSLNLSGLPDEYPTQHPVLVVAVIDSVVQGVFGGVPQVFVGYLYPQGYFRQTIDSNGWQEAVYNKLDFDDEPVMALASKS